MLGLVDSNAALPSFLRASRRTTGRSLQSMAVVRGRNVPHGRPTATMMRLLPLASGELRPSPRPVRIRLCCDASVTPMYPPRMARVVGSGRVHNTPCFGLVQYRDPAPHEMTGPTARWSMATFASRLPLAVHIWRCMWKAAHAFSWVSSISVLHPASTWAWAPNARIQADPVSSCMLSKSQTRLFSACDLMGSFGCRESRGRLPNFDFSRCANKPVGSTPFAERPYLARSLPC